MEERIWDSAKIYFSHQTPQQIKLPYISFVGFLLFIFIELKKPLFSSEALDNFWSEKFRKEAISEGEEWQWANGKFTNPRPAQVWPVWAAVFTPHEKMTEAHTGLPLD